MIDAVLFDLDGVLIDSFLAWVATVNEVAERFGYGPYSVDRVREIWGQGTAADAGNLYPGRSVLEIQRAYDETLPRHVSAVRVNPSAQAVFRDLRARGIRSAIVTNTQDSLAQTIARAKGFAGLVDFVSALRSGHREKPAPDLLVSALEAVGASGPHSLMVGDTRYDEEAALAAGVPFLSYDFATGADLAATLAPRLHG